MEEKIHKRRVHYSGTHPKRFEEKYKEHDPEKYADTIEKVISKGSTPAGMHISICVNEILDFLQIQPGQQGLDAGGCAALVWDVPLCVLRTDEKMLSRHNKPCACILNHTNLPSLQLAYICTALCAR